MYIDMYVSIIICTHKGDATSCPGPPAQTGQVSAERGVRDVRRLVGGVGLGRGGGSRVVIPDINTSGIFSNPLCLYITTV